MAHNCDMTTLDDIASAVYHQTDDHSFWLDMQAADFLRDALDPVTDEFFELPIGVVKAEAMRRAADLMMVEEMARARAHGASWRTVGKAMGRHHSAAQRWAKSHGVAERVAEIDAEMMRNLSRYLGE